MTDLANIRVMSQTNFDNVSSTSDDTLYFVESPDVATYHNETSGYMIWSDGTCIQWGQASATTSGQAVQLTKTYANTNYCVLTSFYSAKATSMVSGGITDANHIKVYSSTGNVNAKWMTIGKLASGQY